MPPLLPDLRPLLLQQGSQDRQLLRKTARTLIPQGPLQHHQVVERAQLLLHGMQPRRPEGSGTAVVGLERFQRIAGSFAALAQGMQGLGVRLGVCDPPARMQEHTRQRLPLPLGQPDRQGFRRQGREAGLSQPLLQMRQQLEVAATAQALLHQLLRQAAFPLQLAPGSSEGFDLRRRQDRQDLLLQPGLQHIQVTGQPQGPTHPRQPRLPHGLRQDKKRPEVLQHRTQPAQAHPQLMQRFAMTVGQHVRLQGHQPLMTALQQSQHQIAVAEAGLKRRRRCGEGGPGGLLVGGLTQHHRRPLRSHPSL